MSIESTPKQLLATVTSSMHEGEKVVSQSGRVYVCKENTVSRLCGDGGASARSGHPRWRPSQTQVSLLEMSIRHIYMAAMLRSIRQHSWGAIAWGNPWAHGLHDNNNQGEQGIIRVRVEELWHTVLQACSVKEGHQVVGYQPHHLRQMFHGNKKESTYIGVSCVWRSPMTWRTAAIGILQNAV